MYTYRYLYKKEYIYIYRERERDMNIDISREIQDGVKFWTCQLSMLTPHLPTEIVPATIR